MKTWAFGLLPAVVLIGLVGCGKQDSPQAAAPVHCDKGVSCKTGVDEKAANDVYAVYKYQEVGACADNTRRFSSLVLADRIVVAKTPEGNDIVADMEFFLNDGGTYSGYYQEKTQVRGDMGFWKTTETKNKKDLSGSWAVQKNQIMIDALGLGDNATVRGWPGIQFTLTEENKVNPVLAKQQINLITKRSMTSKDGQTIEAACAEEKAKAEAGTK